MVYTIKLDGTNNYLVDTLTNEPLKKYDPDNINLQLVLARSGYTLRISAENIIQEYGGIISVQHNDDKYIIDDGYQDTLVKCGYIVYDQYDTKRVEKISDGNKIRDNIIDDIRTAIQKLEIDNAVTISGNDTLLTIDTYMYSYKFRFDMVNNIVNKNYKRKDNGLKYYPFDKSMDKYGTIYLSIFAQKKVECEDNTYVYTVPNDITTELIKLLGPKYHFVSMPIKGRVLYWEGI